MVEGEVDSPLDEAATAGRLHALGAAGALDAGALDAALAIAARGPDALGWRALATRVLTGAGAGLMVAGVIFGFAANWDALHRFARLGAVGGLMLAVAALAIVRRGSLVGRVALTAAAGLVGATLAVYGQVYQTGADVWTLFAGWALLIGPWAVAGRFEPLWVLWLVVVELAVALWIDQTLGYRAEGWGYLLLAGAPAAAWAVGERVGAARWFVRAVFVAAAAALVWVVWGAIFESVDHAAWAVALGALAAAGAVVLRRAPPDLGYAATLAAAAMAIVTAALAEWLISVFRPDVGAVLLVAVAVVAQAGAAAMWLRGLWRRGAR